MNKEKTLALFFTGLAFFTVYQLRGFPIGADSYAYINAVCLNFPLPPNLPFDSYAYINAVCLNFISKAIYSVFPCDLLLFSTISFLLMLFASFTISLLGEVFNREHGWLAGIFAYSMPGFSMQLMRFENDFLAIPFLFLATYLFVQGIIEDNLKKKLSAIGIVLIFTSIWSGSAIYFFAFSLHSLIAATISTGLIMALGWERIATVFVPWGRDLIETFPTFNFATVVENIPLIGVKDWMFGTLGLLAIPQKLWFLTGFWVIAGLLNAKLGIHCVPFLAVGLTCVFSNYLRKQNGRVWVWLLVIPLAGGMILSAASLFHSYPTVEQRFFSVEFLAVWLLDSVFGWRAKRDSGNMGCEKAGKTRKQRDGVG